MLTIYHYAVDETVPIDRFPQFFQDVTLNYAENVLRNQGDDDRIAVISMDEQSLGAPDRYTWRSLRNMIAQYASALRTEGVGKGDLVTCERINLTYSHG